MNQQIDCKPSELMVIASAREIKDYEVCFAGVGLPIVALAYAMQTHAPHLVALTEGGVIRSTPYPVLPLGIDDACLCSFADQSFSMIAPMGALQRGEVDIAFLGGAQVDKYGNINSTGVGEWSDPETFTYFAGSGGANDMASSAKRTVIILPHQKRKLVDKVDYLTSPGYLDGKLGTRKRLGLREGGPSCIITTMGIIRFDQNRYGDNEGRLQYYFPGSSPIEVKDNTGWNLKLDPEVKRFELPSKENLQKLRDLDPAHIYLD